MIAQAHAERMKSALEAIVEGLRDFRDRDPAETLSAQEVLWLAERALNPAVWERAHD